MRGFASCYVGRKAHTRQMTQASTEDRARQRGGKNTNNICMRLKCSMLACTRRVAPVAATHPIRPISSHPPHHLTIHRGRAPASRLRPPPPPARVAGQQPRRIRLPLVPGHPRAAAPVRRTPGARRWRATPSATLFRAVGVGVARGRGAGRGGDVVDRGSVGRPGGGGAK